MACCAFAVLLLMWLTSPLRRFAAWLGILGAVQVDLGVAWNPAAIPSVSPVRRRSRPPLIVPVSILALLAGPAVASEGHGSPSAYADTFHTLLCGPGRASR